MTDLTDEQIQECHSIAISVSDRLCQPIEIIFARIVIAADRAGRESIAMNEGKARKILDDDIQKDGGLYSLGWYLSWSPDRDIACLDGEFSTDDLEAIAWWMRNKAAPSPTQQEEQS